MPKQEAPRMDAPRPRLRATIHMQVLGPNGNPTGVEQWAQGEAHIENTHPALRETSLVPTSPIVVVPLSRPVWEIQWLLDDDRKYYTLYALDPSAEGERETEWVVTCGNVVVVCADRKEADGTAERVNRYRYGDDDRMPFARVGYRHVVRGPIHEVG